MSFMERVRHALTVKRLVLLAVGLLVVVAVVIAVLPEALPVDTGVARYDSLRVTVNAEGITRVRDRYVIAAPVAGRLERLPLAEGDLIRAGDVVARIAPTPLDAASARQTRARLDAARALQREGESRVRVATDAHDQAEREAYRVRHLHEAGALSKQALEEADLLVRTRAADVVAARAHAAAAAADVDQAMAALLHVGGGASAAVSVHAPAAGRVLRVAGRSERVIAPGTPIAEVGDTRSLEVVVDVLSTEAALVRHGMPVLLEGWGGEDTISGHVRTVEPSATTRVSALGVEEQRVDVIVDVPAPPASLGDGYRVDARIRVWEADSVLVAPSSALVRSGTAWRVFVVANDRARSRAVRVGRMGGSAVQVVAGLVPGEEVIVFPSDKVRDGVRVQRRRLDQ